MSNLDPRIEAVRQQYGLAKEDFWQIPQNRQWVCKHAALEIVAAKAKIEWSLPSIIEANTADGIAVLAVTGKMGDRMEWSTGEASPRNNKNAYPWAMAEKRAKDRVVLKLVGIHGLVYSEEEADDFKATGAEPPARSSASLKRTDENGEDAWGRLTRELDADLLDCHTMLALEKIKQTYRARVKEERWPKAWQDALADRFLQMQGQIEKAMENA